MKGRQKLHILNPNRQIPYCGKGFKNGHPGALPMVPRGSATCRRCIEAHDAHESRKFRIQAPVELRFKELSYQTATEWIALNDGPGDEDAYKVGAVACTIPVMLIADVFGKSPRTVATEVVKLRKKFIQGT